jgi:hypothetical protein
MKKVLASFLLACCILGCKPATSTTPPAALAPGALNSFDQTSYTALMAAQASLNSLNSSYKANPAALASLKTVLDQAATDYNVAELAWQTYHAAATSANEAAVTAALTKVQTDLSSATAVTQ